MAKSRATIKKRPGLLRIKSVSSLKDQEFLSLFLSPLKSSSIRVSRYP